MTPESAIAFLKALGSTKFDKSTMPWITGQCPMAPWRHESGKDNQPSFGILTGKVKARCHCFSCRFSGTPEELVADMRLHLYGYQNYTFNFIEALKIAEEDGSLLDLSLVEPTKRAFDDVTPFPESFWHSFPHASIVDKASSYLTVMRKFTHDEVCGPAYDMRWDPNQQRVCVPVRGPDKKLYGIRGRAISPEKMPPHWSYPCAKIINPQVWYGEEWVDFEQPIVVTESWIKAIFARRLYNNTVAPLSAGLSSEQCKRMQKGYLFVHLFDGDKAGRLASKALRSFLPDAKHVELRLPDGEDPDSLVNKYGLGALNKILQGVVY